MAGQPKVLFNGLTSLCLGDDVFDAQTKPRNTLRRPTIAATITGRPGHALAKEARHMGFAGLG
jgi:hypothetical protein